MGFFTNTSRGRGRCTLHQHLTSLTHVPPGIRLVAVYCLWLLLGCFSCLHNSSAEEIPGRRALNLAANVSADQTDPSSAATGMLWVYVGTYTTGKSKGIYLYRLDLESGSLTPSGTPAEVINPSFVAIHPNRRFLYSVNEVPRRDGKNTGAVSAFSIDPKTGTLTYLNDASSGGAGPCHLVVDGEGKNVLVANYGGGSVAALPIDENGQLSRASAFIQHAGSSVNPDRQEGPHAHSINLDSANRFAMAADLGLDKILIYRFDSKRGRLSVGETPWAKVSPGAGPRHFAFHPSGNYAYLINELASTVDAFAYDAEAGALKNLQTISTLPEDFEGESYTAEVQVHPSGKFLYGSNRGHDSIAIYSIDAATGKLTFVGTESTRGKTPRNFGIDPTGMYLLAANQSTDTIVVFRIDQETGKLDATGNVVEVPSPVCVKMMPIEP